MSFEERTVFLLKGLLAVMLLLAGDIFAHGGDIRFGYSKRPIASLPCERGKFIALRLDPFRGSLFDLFHGGTDGDGATEFKENVDVIRDGIDEDGRAAKVLQDGRHVAVQGIAHGVVQEGFAVLGAKDEMDVQPREGLWHGLARPFRALMGW